MKEYKNGVLSHKNSINARNIFQASLQCGIKDKESRQYDPKSFQCLLQGSLQVYNDLKADYELRIGGMEKTLLFFNAFSAEHHYMFVQQQKQYCKIQDDNG